MRPQLDRRDVVLEVGTGTGSLTAMLAQRAGAVVSVEISAELHQLAQEELLDCDNVTLLQLDALKNKNRLDPDLLAVVAAAPGGRSRAGAEAGRQSAVQHRHARDLESAVDRDHALLDDGDDSEGIGRSHHGPAQDQGLQRVERLDSEPVRGGGGAHSAADRVLAAAQGALGDHPHCSRTGEAAPGFPDPEFFHTFVRSLFLHRRKFLRSGLVSVRTSTSWAKTAIDAILAEQEVGAEARAEELDVDQLLH